MKLVYLEWVDARGIGGQMSRKVGQRHNGLLVRTAGILLGEDEEVVRLAQDYWKYEDEDGTEPEVFRDLEIIPKVLVQIRKEFEV